MQIKKVVQYKLKSEIEKLESQIESCEVTHEFYSCLDGIVDYNKAITLDFATSSKNSKT